MGVPYLHEASPMFTAIRQFGILTNFKVAKSLGTHFSSPVRTASLSRTLHSKNMLPRVVVTRRLPPNAQACLEKLDVDIYQWQEDCAIPRETLLKESKGTLKRLGLLSQEEQWMR
jgi:hypothetical protein